ncbi:MAG: valine--tRNA ligase [Patescibacteria group bacterium]
MSDLPKAYNPKETEEKIYKLWEESGFFNPDNLPHQDGKPFTILMPPPNANAPLHVGHALGMTIEDILIRYHRMKGRKALWLPGTDHAGFETQVVFEKKLEKEGRSRFKMTREEFYKECWDFVQANKHTTEQGIRRLGASCDWSRNTFTLDPKVVEIVYETFEQMHKDGLVYRGERIANWCPKHQTGLSDLEVKDEERTEKYYYLKYGPFVISTSRPETKFGDKYVVMHPDDTRYSEYKNGQKIELEWINGPITAIVIKDNAVDMTFGTGVMTITPSHDATDFDIAERHGLEKEQVIDLRGKLLPIAGEFAGVKIIEAREKIIEKLAGKGLVDHIDENYKHSVRMCYKCSTLIEPQVMPQWYVKMSSEGGSASGGDGLRDMAVKAIRDKEVKIVPERFEKVFLHWMENIRDWPISRQIWWGIPIPEKYYSQDDPTRGQETFDTWFSSGQWPYATLLAQGKKDFETYFPTDVLETGWDILFFWVARMIMFSQYKFDKAPFHTVYLHGLVRDKDRQKMSKSKGNVVDPLAVIDTYGTDALRFALVFSTAAGNDIPLSEDKIRGMKHFANKLWNIARYVLQKTEGLEYKESPGHPLLPELIKSVTTDLDRYAFHEAAQKLYDFTWYEFADKFIEETKDKSDPETLFALRSTLCTILKLLHPFMPFVTEEIWGQLPSWPGKKLLIIETWPN